MQRFTDTKEAFEYFLDFVYPSLPPERKVGKLTTAWRNYRHKGGAVSNDLMQEILAENGFKVKTIITYEKP